MRTSPQGRHESPLARLFGQICLVSLAAFITSGAGLLSYLHGDGSPFWLKAVVMGSAALVAVSFVGWLVVSLAAFARDQLSSRQP